MIFFPLLLAHLIADFLLQPERLVRWKHENWKGNALHGLVHFALSFLLLGVYLPNGNVFAALLLVSASHFLIDGIKISFEKRTDRYIWPFLLDQLAHLAVLGIAAYALRNEPLVLLVQPLGWLYTDYAVVGGLCLLLLVSYAWELTLFQLRRTKKSVYKPDYRGMAQRVLVWAALYGLFLLFGVYKIVAFG